jgi:EmrB/QacA subfamily drug resistance transporter
MELSQNGKSEFRWIVISVTFAAFMSKLDSYIVNISLPTIGSYFNVSVSVVSRTVIVYLLVATSTLLFFGKLGDRIGLKKVFILGYAFFTGGSLLCGMSLNVDMLIFSRFVQGIGGAMLVTAGYAIIPKYLPREITGWAFGILSTGAGLGIAAGAPLGGLINGYLSWRWIFIINFPVGIAAIIVAIKAIPPLLNAEDKKISGGFDIIGIILSFFGLSTLIYALNTGNQMGWTSVYIIFLLIASFVILMSFLVWENVCKDPLLDFAILKNIRFLYANLAALCGFMFLAGSSFLLPFYLEIGKGLGTVKVGFLVLIGSAMVLIAGPVGGRLSDRIKPGILCAAAMLSASLCSLIFSLDLRSPGLIPVVVFIIWSSFSFGMFIAPNNNQTMKLAPLDEQGAASGIYNTMNTFGMVLGVTFFESIFSKYIPHHGVYLGKHVAMKDAMQQSMNTGFSNAYIFGGIVCAAALIFSLQVMDRRIEKGHPSE